MKSTRLTFCALLVLTAVSSPAATTPIPPLTASEAKQIALKIWRNECEGTVEGLTSWNEGENFPSLGIGHFIWYPDGVEGPFDESFPKMLAYLRQRGAKLPPWLLETAHCPWKSRREFEAARHGEPMNSLRILLRDTVDLQTEFAARRMVASLAKMTEHLPEPQRQQVETQFNRVAASPGGYYALMDYVNFKGEGTKETERYKGEGWGLLQVLQGMHGPASGQAALDDFSNSAIRVLQRRVTNSPPKRGEQRWLDGWTSRCQSYRNP